MQVKILTFSALYDESCVDSNLFSLLSYITDYIMRDFRSKLICPFETTAGSKHHLKFLNIYSFLMEAIVVKMRPAKCLIIQRLSRTLSWSTIIEAKVMVREPLNNTICN